MLDFLIAYRSPAIFNTDGFSFLFSLIIAQRYLILRIEMRVTGMTF